MNEEADSASDRKRDIAMRNSKKFGCYVLDISHKEMSMHEVKMLGVSIEEGVNEAIKKSTE